MTNSRILVTGANGFLGSEIVRQANSVGLGVRATDWGNASRFSGVKYWRADILDPESLLPALDGVEWVIHAAGLAHIFDKSKALSLLFKNINEKGTANVVSMATKAGIKHFILISSVSVYGGGTWPGCDENSPCHPEGPYAESKWQAEQRAIEIAKGFGMNLIISRMATIYGEEDPGNVARLMRAIDRGRFLWVGDGSNQKSLLHKEDAARAILKVAQTHMNGINIYNVSAPPCTMKEIVEGLSAALGRRIPKWHIPASLALNLTGLAARLVNGGGRVGDLHDTLRKWFADDIYDTTKFESTFNFKPQVELSEGLNREVAWYRHLGTTSLTI